MAVNSIDADSNSPDSDDQSNVGEDIYLNNFRVSEIINNNNRSHLNSNSSSSKYYGHHHRLGANNNVNNNNNNGDNNNPDGRLLSLAELATKVVACHIPFGVVEHFEPPVPEPMQCRIAFWSFPQDEEDIKLYTCLANGNADVFCRAEELITSNCVCDMLQVGFHLSANVKLLTSINEEDFLRVAMTFDRRKITSCTCSCSASTFWCEHTVAVCLKRIRTPQDVSIRAPVSESLQRLEKNQLQKFAQYLINELPQQILPAAQKLLDELLSGNEAGINQNPAAPDPTAGATINEQTRWCLDDTHVRGGINRILNKQCTAQTTVICDVQTLNMSPPPSVSEYSELLRAVNGREPEAIWNLITIVSEMMKRHDSNFELLLDILTNEILSCEKIVTWWFETKVSLYSATTIHLTNNCNRNNSLNMNNFNNNSNNNIGNSNNSNNALQTTSQYSSSNFCDDIVHLWRLAAMDPNRTTNEVERLYKKFFDWHLIILSRHHELTNDLYISKQKQNRRNVLDLFPGFRPALEGCLIQWDDWDRKRNTLILPELKTPSITNQKSKSSKFKKKKKSKARRAAILLQKRLLQQEQEMSLKNSDQEELAETNNLEETNHELHETSVFKNDDSRDDSSGLNGAMHSLHLQDPVESREIPVNSTRQPQQSSSNRDNDIQQQSAQNEDLNVSGSEHDQEVMQEVDNCESSLDAAHRSRRNSASSSAKSGQYNQPIPGLARIDRDLNVYGFDHLEFVEQQDIAAPQSHSSFLGNGHNSNNQDSSPESLRDFIKVNLIRLNDPLETMYAKCESLHAHGFVHESRRLAARVARNILSYPKYPNIRQLCTLQRRRKKRSSLDNRMSIVTSEALSKIIFLCNVLMDCPENYDLVFRLGLFGIEMRRSPAATKFLEVKLISQKQVLISILEHIKLGHEELEMLRGKAQSLIHGEYIKNSDALTTLTLANYILQALVLSKDSNQDEQEPSRTTANNHQSNDSQQQVQNNNNNNQQNHNNHNQQQLNNQSHSRDLMERSFMIVDGKLATDSELGFNATLAALSTKVHFIESGHPLICHGIRRQRCDLALALLTKFKDDNKKLDQILENLLDTNELTLTTTNNGDKSTGNNNSVSQSKNSSSSFDNNQSIDQSQTLIPSSHNSRGAMLGVMPGSASNKITQSKKSGGLLEPTKALSHVMFELAQTVFDRAGGNSLTTYVFRPNPNRSIHHGLHLCSLRIALYSVSLTNRIHPTWIHRTYNRFSSFIHEQALDIGLPAIKLLSMKWEGSLTPLETASLADKAGRNDDPEMRAVAAELAKSCVKYAYILGCNAVQRILAQCKEQNVEMLEDACVQIEQVSEQVLVCPSVLFTVSRAWHGLYMTLIRTDNGGLCENGGCPFMNEFHHQRLKNIIPDWQVTSVQNHNCCKHCYDPPHWDSGEPCIDYLPTDKHVEYVQAAYRVGMRALDIQKPSHHSNKNSPLKEDDIILLLGLSKLLGRNSLVDFSRIVIKNIANPNLLYTIVDDLFRFFDNLPFDHPDRVEMLIPMVDRCIECYVKKIDELVRHFSEEHRSYIEKIIEVTKYLSLHIYTLSAFDKFEKLLNSVKKGRVPRYRTIDVDQHLTWLKKVREHLKNCHCQECTFGREICEPSCDYLANGRNNLAAAGNMCPSYMERSGYLKYNRPYNLFIS